VLEAPLTVEWVAMEEAVEALAIGRLLAVSSCTNGEKVVRGGDRLQRKTRRRREGSGATAFTGGGAEHDQTARRSDTRGREAL
jgi:hypothetical protein